MFSLVSCLLLQPKTDWITRKQSLSLSFSLSLFCDKMGRKKRSMERGTQRNEEEDECEKTLLIHSLFSNEELIWSSAPEKWMGREEKGVSKESRWALKESKKKKEREKKERMKKMKRRWRWKKKEKREKEGKRNVGFTCNQKTRFSSSWSIRKVHFNSLNLHVQ